jgi:NAD(P)-dependent dehydrogenase (short-subunit alcohol dehydrogenase family)
MRELDGKVAVITGGAGGIGRALAECFLDEGAKVMLGDLDPASLQVAADDLAPRGAVATCVVDVTEQTSTDQLREATMDAFGAAHVICNNAGVSGRRHPMAETTDADWDWVVGVNLMGVVHGIRSFVPGLIEQGEGHVVNTASLAGLSAVPFGAPYSATKHAVVGLSQSLSIELQASGRDVGVTVLCPDWLRSDIAESTTNWPTKRLGARPADSDDQLAQMMDAVFTDAVAQAPDPLPYARKAVDAVKADQFLVLTETPLVHAALQIHSEVLDGGRPAIPM